MNEKLPKIKFYNINKDKINNFEDNFFSDIDLSKEIKISKEYSKALLSVIEKDVTKLKSKYNNVIKELKDVLKSNNLSLVKDKYLVDDIDTLLSDLDLILNEISKENKKIKVRILSSDKKNKKIRKSELNNLYAYIFRVKNDIIFIKNEYSKLTKRVSKIKAENNEEFTNEEKSNERLERTLNFYMNKEERK